MSRPTRPIRQTSSLAVRSGWDEFERRSDSWRGHADTLRKSASNTAALARKNRASTHFKVERQADQRFKVFRFNSMPIRLSSRSRPQASS